MSYEDVKRIRDFEDRFGGSIFREDPGERWIYEKQGHCYSLPQDFMYIIKKSLDEDDDYLVSVSKEIEYDSDVLY